MSRILDFLYKLYFDYVLDILNGFKNLWAWKKVIWQDDQIDFTYILIILAKKLKLMENHFKFYGHCLNAKKHSQEMKIVRLLIERIEKDTYTYKIFGKEDYHHAEYLIEQDIEYFTILINKRLRTWWD